MSSYLGQIVRGSEIWWCKTSAHSLSTTPSYHAVGLPLKYFPDAAWIHARCFLPWRGSLIIECYDKVFCAVSGWVTTWPISVQKITIFWWKKYCRFLNIRVLWNMVLEVIWWGLPYMVYLIFYFLFSHLPFFDAKLPFRCLHTHKPKIEHTRLYVWMYVCRSVCR